MLLSTMSGGVVHPASFSEVLDYWDARVGVTAAATRVSAWAPVYKGTNTVVQSTGGNQPVHDSAAGTITFDGLAYYLRLVYTLNQPVEYFLVMKPTGYGTGAIQCYVSGAGGDTSFNNPAAGGNLRVFAGSAAASAAGPTAGSYYIFSFALNGASSYWAYNLNAKNTGNAGATNPAGITIGASFDGTLPAGMALKQINTSTIMTDARREAYIRALAAHYAVPL